VSRLLPRRVRAHVPAGPPPTVRSRHVPRPGDEALLLHVAADERDRLTLATARELVATAPGQVTISERLFARTSLLDGLQLTSFGLRPDVLAGLDLEPLRADSEVALGQLVCRRSYQQRWPLVGWDLGWVLGRLAAHAGPARGGRDGFSVRLCGTGVTGDGAWAPSWHYPSLVINPRSGGQAGAFFSWVPPRNVEARARRSRRADFIDLQILASALAGGDLDDAEQACSWFGVPWPSADADPVAALRDEARALAALYGKLLDGLAQVAPGLAPRDVWTFGSVTEHVLAQAQVLAPLGKVDDVRAP